MHFALALSKGKVHLAQGTVSGLNKLLLGFPFSRLKYLFLNKGLRLKYTISLLQK